MLEFTINVKQKLDLADQLIISHSKLKVYNMFVVTIPIYLVQQAEQMSLSRGLY